MAGACSPAIQHGGSGCLCVSGCQVTSDHGARSLSLTGSFRTGAGRKGSANGPDTCMQRICVPLLSVLAAVAVAGLAETSWARPSQTEIDIYLASDADKDGRLNRPEFKRFVGSMARTGNRKARWIRTFRAYGLAFGIADLNRDGLITPDELIKADAEN